MGNTSGPTDSSDAIRIYPHPDCRFAYTINNMQPVRCTWISDEPLFFADYEAALEEDTYLADDPVFQALEKDIAEMKGKTEVYEKISREFAEPEGVVAACFREDAANAGRPSQSPASHKESVIAILKQSRLASAYLTFADYYGINLAESRQVTDACYDREAEKIFIRPDLEISALVLVTVRELRRAWQHRNGAGLHPLMLHPDHAVLINRAQNADLLISMIRVAWELQLSGYKDAWARVENSQIQDLGRAFAREACVDFRSLNSGRAALACYESWFLSERCRKYDRALIQNMLADYQGYVFSDNLEGSRSIAIDMMKALGNMPFGENYLSSSVNQIMNDPIFTDVRDRSSANFLWFIKFERSFAEAEHIIEEENIKVEKLNAQEPVSSAMIITFPERTVQASSQTPVRNGSASSVARFPVGRPD